jgi:hypothetical protein
MRTLSQRKKFGVASLPLVTLNQLTSSHFCRIYDQASFGVKAKAIVDDEHANYQPRIGGRPACMAEIFREMQAKKI